MYERRVKYAIDWFTVIIYLILVICGWISIYGASHTFEQTELFNFDYRSSKQLVWIAGAMIIGVITMLIDYRFYEQISYLFYGLMIIALLATPLLAHDIKGSMSWIVIGPVSIQPAEIAKVATALAIARFMNSYGYRVNSLRDLIIPAIMLLVPMFIIMVPQKETGSALVFASLILMFYREGMTPVILLLGVAAVIFFVITIAFAEATLPLGTGTWGITACMIMLMIICFIYVYHWLKLPRFAFILAGINTAIAAIALTVNIWLNVNMQYVSIAIVLFDAIYTALLGIAHNKRDTIWIAVFAIAAIIYCLSASILISKLKPHQRNRIMVTLGVIEDRAGQGYNVNQAKIAIGSGGLWGKGLGSGTQTKLKYVPEQDTDFIFCTVGEEHGFVGTTFVLLLYLTLLIKLIIMSERQKDNFSRIYGYCVTCILFFHLAVNVGMVIGLVPVIGIPLPFFSYGGSSLWAFTLLLFIFLRLDAARLDRL
ncbi:MAG TPA: rod shape-determining protein RodA [Bacteroidales bacterium]|nr:rod shape-determining protein RodA [Bacteroidales bacterium]